ncbi:MAG: amino acid adenylation domain-containing protein [Actinophytocola sp.]|uniref:non-ribosomal peptide synthetase/type I polyketide synthase n=1 Tax=Actinophytocola sp. TaxID=1872138 RepID=UPI003C777859
MDSSAAAACDQDERIAIIGIGCRLPGGASDHRTFWQNLVSGKDCITRTPADRYDVTTLASRDKAKPGRLVGGRGGYIDGFDEFDPAFFGISPREAEHMDPQQRKLLEVSWEALEDGGQRPSDLAGQDVGVFVGAFTLDYKIIQFADLSFDTLAAHTATGTMMTMVSNRISYCFDFRGPSVSIDTACSSSLVAVHLACESLRRGESSVALAGGTLLHMTPQYTIAETKGGFLSPDGRSRAFDAAANGYVRAEGVGVVVLKLLRDCLRDGDPIHAVILGSGVNQDGRTNGITVPNPDAQTSLIERVCAQAGITPGDLQYIEAHGTSTPVGDPVEANALGRALSIGRRPGDRCYVGSVKTNIGHTESAAGIAGLIKTALSLKHRMIPPHINLERINPGIDMASLPFEIPTRLTEWPDHDGPARAGVNAFGFGGTNAHVLLERAPEQRETTAIRRAGWTILPITARDPAALPDLAAGIRAERTDVTDLGNTLAHRRQQLPDRLSVVHDSRESLDERLASYLDGQAHPHVLTGRQREPADRRLVWVFTGMGPQWWAMGRQLFDSEPVYRAAVEACDREITRLAGWSLIDEMTADEASSNMSQTWLAQPANFAVQTGLAALWRHHGVVPDAIVGHSTGEVAAFHAAGVYSLTEAITVVLHRSRLQQRLVGTGTMLAASLAEDEARHRILPYGDRVSVAAVNSPSSVTLAGDRDTLAVLAAALEAERIFARFLTVEVPYHSARMELVKDELLDSLAGLTPGPATLPLYLTGRPGRADGPELDAGYWWTNVREHVGFRAAVDRLATDGLRVFLEVGPHPVLGNAIKECLAAMDITDGVTLPSIRRHEDEPARFMTSLAALHNLGVEIDWHVLHPGGRPVTLPRYPFRRDRYWVEPAVVEQVRLGRLDHPLLGRRLANAEPTWETRLDVETLPYLADHRLQGNVVLPAAGYLEMAMQAVRAMTGGATAALADIELRKALFLTSAEARTVQLSFSSDAAFTVATVDGAVHSSGVVRASQRRSSDAALDAAAVRARCVRELDRTSCYAGLAAMGYGYGPAFQSIERVWLGDGEALALIQPAEPLDTEDHHMHPVLLDACFQTLLTPQLLGNPAGMRLPVSITEVRMDQAGPGPLLAHATVTNAGDELTGDIAVYRDDGTPLGRISGFRAADVEKAPTAISRHTIDGWLTEVSWIPAPPIEQTGAITGTWLVFADSHGVAGELAELVRADGGRCHLVRPGDYRFGADESTVVPGRAADLSRLLTELGPVHTIVHLWNLDLPPIDETARHEFTRHTSTGSYSLIAQAQALLSEPAGDTTLHIVTRGTQAVVPGDVVEPLGAPAWGIGRVLWHQELTAHRGTLIDLDPAGTAEGQARALLREITGGTGTGTGEIALRGDERYTSRLTQAADLPRPLPLRLRADGSYLVTGAFGALGRLLCRTLVLRGARRLILVGRSRLPERDWWREVDPDSPAGRNVRFLKELEALGAQPILAPLDITDEAGLTTWLRDYRQRELPPVRGVFHLAGHVRDTLVGELDRTDFDAVYDPKVLGAYLLHQHLRDEPLEHFVLFASIASLLTTAGQTNYAAGNAFLDALAHHRRALGLPALSIDWGPWATGMIEELGLIDHYRTSRGMHSLSPRAGMAVLEHVIGQDRAQLVVATVVDWQVFLAWYPTPPPLVAGLAAAAGPAQAPRSGRFLDTVRDADDEQRELLVTARLTQLVAEVLGAPADQVDHTARLSGFGLDSLLAMELRARMHTELGVSLPMVALLSRATVGELARQVHDALLTVNDQDEDTDIEVFTDPNRHPLTQNQTALWFLKQLNPDGFAYNIGGAVQVRVALDPGLMCAAAHTLVERHPSLRANFALENGQAVQLLRTTAIPDIAVVDVEGTPWDDVYRMIIQEYRRPYDLEHDSLLRFRLYRRADDHWVIMKAVHHIISDAISTFTFIEELLAVYEGLLAGRDVELAPVPATYLDFLNWQNRVLAGKDAQRMLEYWRQRLPERIPQLTLPTDRPRPVVQTHNGASEFFVLDAERSARVHACASEHDVTVFVVLLAAYHLLLHRYSGQDDIIVGSPVTGRTRDEFASVYGYFVNPLPLHADLAGDPSVAELLAQIRATVLGGLDNQAYPFVLLVEKLGLRHDPSRSAVFQAMFILLAHKVSTEQYGYRLEYVELPEEEGQFDVTLSAYEDEAERRFHCVFKYNTDLFAPATMRRMAGHYMNLLDALTGAAPTLPVSELAMLGAGERARILDSWSGADRLVSYDEPVHVLISRVAAARPDAIAVTMPGAGGLTYAELDRRAGQLACRLRALGVRDGAVVALCLDKSPELVLMLLAVLRAGGAYLPLDPAHPADRLGYQARTAGAALAVIDAADQARLAGLAAVVLTPAELRAEPTSEPLPAEATDLAATAYVIYTSGSSGRPKAVRVSHRNLASAGAAWRQEYDLRHDVHLQMASFSFDVFTGDLVRALCSGGTLVLVGRELLFDTAALYETMRAERVDCAEFVPVVMRGLISHCERGGLSLDFMRLLIVGSDTWRVEEHRRLTALCGPDTRVVNSYGLSETTIDSAYFDGPVDDLEPSRMVPIGRPFPNSTLYILDTHGEPVPPGVTGELWVGGDGVTTGYASAAGRYRTGDLAHWDTEGNAHLLGRADSQVKVRGHRIEPGEIEARLLALPEVAEAVVTVRTGEDGDPVLCGYCVPVAGAVVDGNQTRRLLGRHLPTFMIPSYVISLGELPLTPNGKVDLAALPAPGRAEATYEPPATLYEVRMAEHWKCLLGLEQAGLRHDFFESGGSSVRLIELIYHLRAEFGVTIPVSRLFAVTTLHGMAKAVEDIVTGRTEGAAPYLRFNTGDGRPTIFCFPPAGGHGLIYRGLATHLPDHQLVAFNHLPGDDRIARYADLVESLAGPGVLFGYSLGGNVAFEVAKELEHRGHKVPQVVIMDSYRISEEFELGTEAFAAFEQELGGHLRLHTGSEIVAEETLSQAREYIEFCGRTPNVGMLTAPVSVISDEVKMPFYADGEHGTWQGSSATGAEVLPGFGVHAAMLDERNVALNAAVLRDILTGSSLAQTHVA